MAHSPSEPVHIQARDRDNPVLAWISEPRDITFGMWLFCISIMGGGLLVYALPPQTALIYVGPTVLTIWPGLWFLGGLVGTIFTLQGYWGVERAALVLIFSGSLGFLAYMAEAWWLGTGNYAAHMIAAVLGYWLFWYRWRTIYLHDINPEKA